ncbi:MAG TPA: diacylglycerol kinase [Candidatus Paceibacterota bacterium]
MLGKIINSFMYAWRGFVTTWKEENNFRIEVFITIIILFFIYFFDFSLLETAISVLAITIVLCAEVINTAIEDLCNKVEPNHDPIIAKIKDTSSAFVLVSVGGSVFVGFLIFYNHFF